MTTCAAIRELDEVACGPCGLRWAVDDKDPPACKHCVRYYRPRHVLAQPLWVLDGSAAHTKHRQQMKELFNEESGV